MTIILVPTLLMPIYFIGGYWWLLMDISGYSINGYW